MDTGKQTLFAGLCLLATVVGTVTAAHADARTCRRLEAKLASLQTSGDPGIRDRYERAVAEQRDELMAARKRARTLDCGFVMGFGSAECQALNMRIEQMEANLADLQRKRDLLARRAGGGYDRERAMVEGQMAAAGCTGDRYADRLRELGRGPTAIDENEGNLFDRLGNSSIEYAARGDDNVISIPSQQDDYSIKAYRTMCVRTCDGYYFPMSPMSSRDDFGRDQQNCESICPGTEMRVYYQPSGRSDVGTMMSAATEEPYPDLSTAYLYRRADVERPPACGCGRIATAQNYSIIAGAGSAAAEEAPASPVIPHPWSRPDVAADPETLSNAEGGLDIRQMRELTKPKAAKLPPPGERRIRVVGPTFLPDPTKAEAPPVQDPTKVR